MLCHSKVCTGTSHCGCCAGHSPPASALLQQHPCEHMSLSSFCSSILTHRIRMSRQHSSRGHAPSGTNLGSPLALQEQAAAQRVSRSPQSSRDGAGLVSPVRRGGADPVLEGRPAWGSSGTVAPTQSPQRAVGTGFTPREPRRSRDVSLRVRSRRVA